MIRVKHFWSNYKHKLENRLDIFVKTLYYTKHGDEYVVLLDTGIYYR